MGRLVFSVWFLNTCSGSVCVNLFLWSVNRASTSRLPVMCLNPKWRKVSEGALCSQCGMRGEKKEVSFIADSAHSEQVNL